MLRPGATFNLNETIINGTKLINAGKKYQIYIDIGLITIANNVFFDPKTRSMDSETYEFRMEETYVQINNKNFMFSGVIDEFKFSDVSLIREEMMNKCITIRSELNTLNC